MSSNIAISLQDVSKCYQIYDNPIDRLKKILIERLQTYFTKLSPPQFYRDFWAVKDVNLEILAGQTIGIIGKNGSGKSTILQLICNILKPTSGKVIVNGRVAALLELGSGFNPEFTGRENVVLNASILGLSESEIQERFQQILDFSGVENFIDQPIKTYSSGMIMRLAFSVIAHVDADILVIDEALSVGDVFFTQKCMRFLKDFQKSGKTIVFVSHDVVAVKSLCDKAILISNGSVILSGNVDDICKMYLENIYADRMASSNFSALIESEDATTTNVYSSIALQESIVGNDQPNNMINVSLFLDEAESFGKGGAKIIDVWFEDEEGVKARTLFGGSSVCLKVKVRVLSDIELPIFGFIIKDRLGQFIFAESTDYSFRGNQIKLFSGNIIEGHFHFVMPFLFKGEYSLTIAYAQGIGDDHFQHHYIYDAILLTSHESRLVHGICGVQGLRCEMNILRTNIDV